MKKVKFKISGMSCAACVSAVERAINRVGGTESCSVSLLLGVAVVEGDVDARSVVSAVRAAGYGAEIIADNDKNVNKTLQKDRKDGNLVRLIVSFVLLFPLMYLSMGRNLLGAPLPAIMEAYPFSIALAQMILCIAVMCVNYRFFLSGFLSAARLSPNMDTLVALGSLAAFGYSAALSVELFVSGDSMLLMELYFESSAMILALILVGKTLEGRAKGKTTEALRSLLELSPKMATVERGGELIQIPAEEVGVGEVFILRPGDRAPADGEVIEGESSVDESALTGESMPADKSVGDRVLCASVNRSGYLRCRAARVGADTAIAEVVRLVEQASATKAPIARVADKISAVFVPFVLAVSLVTFVCWLSLGAEVGYAIGRAISVLVISCPCALGLATPVAITVGAGVGARLGILYKTASALECVGRAKIVALDKTGTVTRGEPGVSDLISFGEPEELMRVALSLEQKSEHPLARAVVSYIEDRGALPCEITGFEVISGFGVRGELSGDEILGVSASYASAIGALDDDRQALCTTLAEEGKTPMVFIKGGVALGVIAARDEPREDSASAIAELASMGCRVVMLTGDNEKTARAVGALVGIEEIYANMLPADKAELISRLSDEGVTVMVGDGINDAPSLASADVGVAIGAGADVAVESADVVLTGSSLTDACRAIRLGRKALKNIYENLFWAFIYNSLGIPLAAGVFSGALGWEMSPMLGALAMSLSSFSVVMNALRLNAFAKKERRRSTDRADMKKSAIKFDDKSPRGSESCEFKAESEENPHGPCGKTAESDDVTQEEKEKMTVKLKIEGMMCPHCEARVKNTILQARGVSEARVSHADGEAVVLGDALDAKAIAEAVEAQGYKVLSIE